MDACLSVLHITILHLLLCFEFFHASLFRQFVDACGQALSVNERLIKEDQQEYHDEMKANYRNLTRELSNIMHEQVETLKNDE